MPMQPSKRIEVFATPNKMHWVPYSTSERTSILPNLIRPADVYALRLKGDLCREHERGIYDILSAFGMNKTTKPEISAIPLGLHLVSYEKDGTVLFFYPDANMDSARHCIAKQLEINTVTSNLFGAWSKDAFCIFGRGNYTPIVELFFKAFKEKDIALSYIKGDIFKYDFWLVRLSKLPSRR